MDADRKVVLIPQFVSGQPLSADSPTCAIPSSGREEAIQPIGCPVYVKVGLKPRLTFDSRSARMGPPKVVAAGRERVALFSCAFLVQ